MLPFCLNMVGCCQDGRVVVVVVDVVGDDGDGVNDAVVFVVRSPILGWWWLLLLLPTIACRLIFFPAILLWVFIDEFEFLFKFELKFVEVDDVVVVVSFCTAVVELFELFEMLELLFCKDKF